MLHTTNPLIKHKTGLLNLAEELSSDLLPVEGCLRR
jgi:hypothetical protein